MLAWQSQSIDYKLRLEKPASPQTPDVIYQNTFNRQCPQYNKKTGYFIRLLSEPTAMLEH